MPNLRAILFDLDGVLVRSEEPWYLTLDEAARRFGDRPITHDDLVRTFGQGTEADIREFGLSCTVPELDRFYTETFPRFASATWVNPEAAPLLQHLIAHNLRLAVVTNTVSSLATIILRAASLEHLFDFVVCADQVAHPKPAPDLPLAALRALKLQPLDVLMVGDSRYDREAASQAKIRFVGLCTDGDVRIERLSELLSLAEIGLITAE